MILYINIGLLNNPKNAAEIYEYLNDGNEFTVLDYKTSTGSYGSFVEPTFVARLSTDYARLSKIIEKIENLCSVLTQECIAIHADQFDLLVYNISFTGTRFKFDSDYFIY